MSRHSTTCQILINALQATDQIKGLSVVATLEAANAIAREVKTSEFELFDFQPRQDGSFKVKLK